MKLPILTLLIGFFVFGNLVQAQSNPSSYYRKIASEQRKLRTKQVNFYKTSLLYTDQKRLDKGRDMILVQIESALKNMGRMPAYKGDSAIRNDYVRILDVYKTAYTTAYDSVQKMSLNMRSSEKSLKEYQDAFYYMEGLVDEGEEMWLLNEEYFTGYYNVTPMDDPTLAPLTTLRSLAVYVQDIRSSYASVPFMVANMQNELKAKKYDNLEDQRQNLALAAEQSMVAVSKVGDYYDEDDREDDFLRAASIYYLEYVRDAADREMAEDLTTLDEARYEEDDKLIEKAHWRIEKILTDFEETEVDLNERIEKFVGHYVQD